MTFDYAPIGISTYIRIEHLKKNIKSLKKNKLSAESNLYIFSDGAKPGDEKKVEEIRSFLETIDGFNKVVVVKREANNRAFNNRDGIRQLLDEYGKMIFLEEDILTSPSFLQYINDALNFFQNYKSVFAINGYNAPQTKNTENDFFLTRYFSGWGFATWRDRNYYEVLQSKDMYLEVLNNKTLYKKIKKYHPGLIPALKKIHDGTLVAGDYKIEYHILKHDFFVVKPNISYVNNIGHDGTGLHSQKTDKFFHENLNYKPIKFYKKDYSHQVDKVFYNTYIKKQIFFKRLIVKVWKIISKH